MSVEIRNFKRVVFFTGAGLSKASGIPTFRGAGGIWKEYEPERYACQSAFDHDPEAVWEFHNYRRELVGACDPNRAHELIARVVEESPLGIVADVVTQNIDGLHQLAGATGVCELHGGLWRVRDEATGELKEDRSVPFSELRTPSGGYWRPDIVWFGDMLDPATVRAAERAIGQCDLLISIGTSGVVYPAAEMPLLAKKNGAFTVEVNPEPTAVSHFFDETMRVPAVDAMESLCEGLW